MGDIQREKFVAVEQNINSGREIPRTSLADAEQSLREYLEPQENKELFGEK